MSRRRAWLIALCLCLPLALVGCVEGRGDPYTLSTLHLAGLRHLPGLERILDRTSGSGAIGAAIIQMPGDATPRALLNAGGQLEVANLDGSGERSLKTTSPCYGMPVATPDGQWGACLGNDKFGYSDQLEIVSLAAGASQHNEIHLISGFYYGLAWSPDASRLALVAENGLAPACSVAVYGIGADHSSLTLTATYTSEVFDYYGSCTILAVGWSPDGTRIEVAATSRSPAALLVDARVPVASSLAAASDIITIPGKQFTSVPDGNPFSAGYTAWNPQSSTLAQVDGGTLYYYPTKAGQIGTWFAISDGQHFLGDLAWSPDGRQLLLIVVGPSCVDNCAGHALPDVYLYTPPAP